MQGMVSDLHPSTNGADQKPLTWEDAHFDTNRNSKHENDNKKDLHSFTLQLKIFNLTKGLILY